MAYPDTFCLRVESDTFFIIVENAAEVNGVFEVFPVTGQMSAFRARPGIAMHSDQNSPAYCSSLDRENSVSPCT